MSRPFDGTERTRRNLRGYRYDDQTVLDVPEVKQLADAYEMLAWIPCMGIAGECLRREC